MKRANRLGSRLTLILGEEELGRGACILKQMADGTQEEVPLAELTERAVALLSRAREGQDRR